MNATDTAQVIEHRIGENGTLTVHVASWDVEVVAAGGDTVRVRSANGAALPAGVEVERTADSLSIRQPSRFGITITAGRASSTTTKLVIEVPDRATVAIQTASGDVQAARLHGSAQIKTASGDVLLVDVAGEVQAETVSGDVAIRLDGPTGLGVRTVSGDVIVDGGRVDRFSFTTTSGDLRMKSELGAGPHAIASVSGDAIITTRNGIRVSAQTVAGDLSSDLPHTSEGRPGRRSLVVGEGTTVVQFRSTSGDLRVVGPKAADELPAIPVVPQPPAPPAPPAAPALPASASAEGVGAEPEAMPAPDGVDDDDAANAAADDAHLEILRALERGEISVEEATSRLASLDGPSDV
jgi:hypothetical protein